MNAIRSDRPAPAVPAQGPALLASHRGGAYQASEPAHLYAQPRVLACSHDSQLGTAVVRHAIAVAKALDLPVTVARVLETPRHSDAPADPIRWQLRRAEGRRALDQIAAVEIESAPNLESVLLAGPAADELERWGKDHDVTLMALATHERGRPGQGLGSTAHRLLERRSASLLLIPPEHAELPATSYRRLLVPLDGSPRSESVLPVAIRIARAHGAELILAYVVPRVEIVEDSVIEGPARDLCERLEEHNERRARAYLEGLRNRLWRERLPARSIVASHGDPRSLLRRLAVEHHVDLIIASSHGRSGMNDVPCGSVTEYLANHAPAPLLIVRPNFAHVFGSMAGAASERRAATFPQSGT